jgi:hypothetical protein
VQDFRPDPTVLPVYLISSIHPSDKNANRLLSDRQHLLLFKQLRVKSEEKTDKKNSVKFGINIAVFKMCI